MRFAALCAANLKLDGGHWAAAAETDLPEGLQLPTVAPSPDGKRAICIWEADSVDSVRSFVDTASEGMATNEYFEVNEQNAQGLPA